MWPRFWGVYFGAGFVSFGDVHKEVRCFQMLRVFDLSFDGNYLNSSGSFESLLMCSKSISIEKLF